MSINKCFLIKFCQRVLFIPKTKEHKPYRYFKKPGRKPINYFDKKYDDWVVIEKCGNLDKLKNPYSSLESIKTKQLIKIRQDVIDTRFEAKAINKVARKSEIPKQKKSKLNRYKEFSYV